MSRGTVILVAVVAVIVAVLIGLASVNTARAPTRVEKDMLNGAEAR